MIHIGRTQVHIISRVSPPATAEFLPRHGEILKGADGRRNYSQCDHCCWPTSAARTLFHIDVKIPHAQMSTASTSKISEDQLFYCRQRGIASEDAVSMIVNGF